MDNKDLADADRALVPAASSLQAVSTKGFDHGERMKPCPFCGCREDSPIESVVQLVHVEYDREHNPRGDWWTVQCDGCTATMGSFPDPDEAVDAWNTRAPQADTHPKDGDVKQAPLVSGGGPEGMRQNTDGLDVS